MFDDIIKGFKPATDEEIKQSARTLPDGSLEFTLGTFEAHLVNTGKIFTGKIVFKGPEEK